MARPNVLFLVHGVGEQRGGWSQLPKKTLREAARGYDCFPTTPDPLEQEIEFVEIRYDDIFDLILRRFSHLTDQFREVDDSLVPAALRAIREILSRPESLAARYAGDVLLYKLKLVSTTVLLRVMRQITETVARIGRVVDGQAVRYGILGHSLGTTVVHDALQLLATTPVTVDATVLADLRQALPELADDYVADFGTNPFGDGNFLFDAVFMVSNISKLLSTTVDPYASRVRPFSPQNPQGICTSFYNIDHKWDPISKVGAFELDQAWDGNTAGAAHVEVEHLYQKNVHALDHYLLNPLVHGAIFYQLAPGFGVRQLRAAQERVATGAFPRWGPGFEPQDVRAAVEQRLRAMLRDAAGEQTAARLRELRTQLKQLTGD